MKLARSRSCPYEPGVFAAGAALFMSLVARAASAQDAISLDYATDAACPPRETFVRQVRARTDRLTLAPAGDAASVFRVRAEVRGGVARGRFEVLERATPRSSREVEGPTCQEVIEALALVVALTIDPNASTGPLPAAPPSRVAPPVPAPSPSPAPPPPVVATQRWRWHAAAAVGAEIDGGVTPSLLVGPRIAIEAISERDEEGILGPILNLRLGLVRAGSTTSGAVGSARFHWTVGHLEGCFVRAVFGPLELLPCVRFDGGVIEGAGAGVDNRFDASRAWLAAGAVGRVRVDASSVIFVDIDGAIAAALKRDHFYFDRPATTLYDVPKLGGSGGVDLGVRFW